MDADSTLTIEAIVRQYAWLLLGAACIGVVAQQIRIPYAVLLVIAGLLIEESHVIHVPTIEPAVVLLVFLPPLLFDAAFRTDIPQLRSLLRPVLLLALPGTLITSLLVGVVLWLTLGIGWWESFLFGTIVAATDPVAVVAIFHRLGLAPRLVLTAEAESLLNDGMAITLYTAVLGIATTMNGPDIVVLAELFGREVFGGILIGLILGFAGSRLTALIDDHLVEMMISTALAYGSYLIAQSFGASGPLACVFAGFVHGSYGRRVGMSETSTRLLDDLWTFLGFLANSIVFLLVGFSASLGSLVSDAGSVAIAVVTVLVTRVLVVALVARISGEAKQLLDRPGRVALIWGGLRGALTISLALALPVSLVYRETIINLAFGVVLFSLVVQGTTLTPLLNWLNRRYHTNAETTPDPKGA